MTGPHNVESRVRQSMARVLRFVALSHRERRRVAARAATKVVTPNFDAANCSENSTSDPLSSLAWAQRVAGSNPSVVERTCRDRRRAGTVSRPHGLTARANDPLQGEFDGLLFEVARITARKSWLLPRRYEERSRSRDRWGMWEPAEKLVMDAEDRRLLETWTHADTTLAVAARRALTRSARFRRFSSCRSDRWRSSVRGGLDAVELGILAARRHQLVVRPDLDDAGAIEYHDQIGHAHGREAV